MFYFREMEEITIFIKNAISEETCLGRCLYIHGVPGTGKVCLYRRMLLYFILSSKLVFMKVYCFLLIILVHNYSLYSAASFHALNPVIFFGAFALLADHDRACRDEEPEV